MIDTAADGMHARAGVPAITVIIVTYNSASTIETCLTALEAALTPIEVSPQVIIWDNASGDDTLARIHRHPLANRQGFTLVASSDNLGFGGANNAAAAQARAPVLLLLNPDAFLDDPRSIVQLHRAMTGAGAGIVGPFLANADGSHQVGDAGHAETLAIAALWALGLNLLPGVAGSFLSRSCPPDQPPFAIDWICGACLMIERALFDGLGGFDTRIFLYSEDVDLCLRAGQQGARVMYVPAVRVRHIQGVSLNADPDGDANIGANTAPSTRTISTTWLDSRFTLFERANSGAVARAAFGIVLIYGFGWRWAAYALSERLSPARAARGMAARMWTYARFSWKRMRLRRDRPIADNGRGNRQDGRHVGHDR